MVCAATMDQRMTLISSLANIIPGCDQDNLSTAIYDMYSYLDDAVRQNLVYTELDYKMPTQHCMYIILKNALENEIKNTPTPETVLRVNSMATKLMQQYLKLQNGNEFLHKFCRPIIGMCLMKTSATFPEEIIASLDLYRFKSLFNSVQYNDIEIDPNRLRKTVPKLPNCP